MRCSSLIYLLLIFAAVEAGKRRDWQKIRIQRLNARRAIILCCGKISCSQSFGKNSNTNASLRTANVNRFANRTSAATALTTRKIDAAASTVSALADAGQGQAGKTGASGSGVQGAAAEEAGAVGNAAAGTTAAGGSQNGAEMLAGGINVASGSAGASNGAAAAASGADGTASSIGSNASPTNNIAGASDSAAAALSTTAAAFKSSSSGPSTLLGSASNGMQNSATPTTPTSPSTTTTTSTTTKPKLCFNATCETYKKAVATPVGVMTPKGEFWYHENKLLFYSLQSLTLVDAMRTCHFLNMTLMLMENLTALPGFKSVIESTTKSSIWTSGSSEGLQCDEERTYTWCSTGKSLAEVDVNNSKLWEKPPDGIPSSEKCLVLTPASVLKSTNCGSNNAFMCQAKLFQNNLIVKPEQYGIWAETCGNTYLFGNTLTTWSENAQKCCSLGMDPIIISSTDQQKCLSDFTSSSNWSGNFNYWTGGSQSCKGMWGWCSGSTFQPFSASVKWAPNQPEYLKSTENCMHMRILQNVTGVVLSDRECNNRYVFACQAKQVPRIQQPACPKTCAKKATQFLSNGSVIDPFLQGDWYTTCGRTLFFPFIKATWTEAYDYCCSYDMKLLSVDSSLKHACLSKLAKRYNKITGMDLWTSATDVASADYYMWCSEMTDLRHEEVNWKSGQPSSAEGDCVFLQFSNSSANASVYALGKCEEKRSFVCEKPQGDTEAETLQSECMSLYNISSEEMEGFSILNLNYTHIPLKLKCFVKCIGDLTNLLNKYGNLALPIAVWAMVEDATQSNADDLQKNAIIVDECGNKVNPDNCALAAEIYQCFREKAPAIANVIQNQLNDTSPLPGANAHPCVPVDARFCRMSEQPCDVVDAMRDKIMSTGTNLYGTLKTAPSGKKYYMSNYNTHFKSFAYKHCCQIGMQLAEIYTEADWDFLASKMLNKPSQGFVGEVFLNGQSQDVWCNSKRVITQRSFYMEGSPVNKCNEDMACYSFQSDGKFKQFYGFCAEGGSIEGHFFCSSVEIN